MARQGSFLTCNGASLANIDPMLMRTAAFSGARPHVAFHRVMLPLILPGVLSGAAFAFVASSMSW
jgi:putative spermidine/putrescine transport system permease protein